MRNLIVLVIIVLILAAVAYTAFRPRTNAPAEVTVNGEVTASPAPLSSESPDSPSVTDTSFSPVINASFNLVATNYRFDVPQIKVKKGDQVKITLTNMEGVHDLVIDELSVAIPQIRSGETAAASFVADKTGTFEYYCSIGNHRQMGMVGKLVVEEKE